MTIYDRNQGVTRHASQPRVDSGIRQGLLPDHPGAGGDLRAAVAVPVVTERLNQIGLYPAILCGADFATHVDQQIGEHAQVIKATGIKGA